MALNSDPLMLGVAPKERRLCAVLIAGAEENFMAPVEVVHTFSIENGWALLALELPGVVC